jgi:hypothetical protein
MDLALAGKVCGIARGRVRYEVTFSSFASIAYLRR